MNAEEYVQAAIRTEHTPNFIRLHGESDATNLIMSRCMHALLGMMTELGELADQFKKRIVYGRALDMVNVVEELSDGDWYRALFADAIKVGFEQAWQINIAKLRKRFPDKFTQAQALTRDLDAERSVLEAGTADIDATMPGKPSVMPGR